ncbi:MAG: trypsin-like peptidase domain-containing protein [Chitinophagales bacterium]|nr:trypsin-like peptidase domain-containing protein [Saprospiraceae bacterium]MCB9019454.1 trypsin-like peptidase domain-containing protein [Chitinophagales bacterium]MCB9312600.1 trypsin-like peptidase domain-containing protein [Lewinellaceae bacterium]
MVRLLIFSLLLWSSCRHDPPVDPASRAAAEEAALAREQARLDSIRTAAISAYLDSITRALPAQPIPLADLYERASEGVYLILSVNDYGEVAQGTGFLINANGLLVTNYHVVEDMVEGAVVYEPGKFVMIDRVIRQDTVRDWAVIRVMPGLPPGVVLPVAREMPRVGEEVFTIGNPKGLAQTLSTGIISGYRGEDQLIQTTAEITHGSSGGPLFNRRGEVIGITTMGLGEANLNFAVNISRLKIDDLLDHPVPGRTVSPVLPYHGRVRAYLEAYYRARMSGEADQLSACYAPKVMQHFENFVLSSEEAARLDADQRWSGRDIPVNYEPHWDRIILDALEDGIAVRLPVLYSAIDRSSDDTRQDEVFYQFELDSLYRIRRVDILD